MKRPFFFLAVFLIFSILTFRFFFREDVLFPGHISFFTSAGPRRAALKGTVISDPFDRYSYFRDAQVFIVGSQWIKVSKRWLPVYGNIRVTYYGKKRVKYGDEILFEAAIKEPFKGRGRSFDYRKYLRRFGVYALASVPREGPLIVTGAPGGSSLKGFAYGLKDPIRRGIADLFRPPERYFLSAVILGQRQDIPREWRDIFIKTQTMHLLAISGLHIGIIAFIILFFAGLLPLPRDFRYAATILILILYAVMIGGRPSVARATIMSAVFLASYIVKRDADIYNSLGLAAALILIYNPDQLFDYGFILSFTSVASIVYLTPWLNALFGFDGIDRGRYRGAALYYLATLFSASCAVWLGITPLTVNLFNIVSPVSVVVNILAIPSLFIILSLSVFALIVNLLFPFLASIFAEAAKFFIAILISFLKLFSKVPFAYLEAEPRGIVAIILYYVFLIALVKYTKKRRFH